MVGARGGGHGMPVSGAGPAVPISPSAACRLRQLVEKGDALTAELARASGADKDRIRSEIEALGREIADARSGLIRPHEVGALRSRADESERDLDALLDALEADGNWSEVARLAEREIHRLDDLLVLRRQKKQRIDPWLRERIRSVVERHNRALDKGRQ